MVGGKRAAQAAEEGWKKTHDWSGRGESELEEVQDGGRRENGVKDGSWTVEEVEDERWTGVEVELEMKRVNAREG
jgi:hypothetical protein